MRKFLIVFVLFSSVNPCFSQFQAGVFGGISNYQGDLTDKPFRQPGAAFGIQFGYQLTNRITLKAGLTTGMIYGADSLNKESLHFRNLSFQSRISELSIIGEFNTLDLSVKTWSPYVFAGLAVYHFNPYTYDQKANLVYLRPLSTEGQGIPGYQGKYSLTQLAIPIGGGIKFRVSEKFELAAELGFRKLFTDYLDDVSGVYADPNDIFANRGQEAIDVSYRGDEVPGGNLNYPLKGDQRGSPKYKDLYYFTGVHLTYIISSKEGYEYNPSSTGRPSNRKSKKMYGCPTVF
jgi:hypothetical protein